MPPIRVSPTEVDPTHHVAIEDRQGRRCGLVLCDDKGRPLPQYNKVPIETTALKQTTGASSYDIFDYPYSPVVQDDWSGGRGSKDFERDSTKYFDALRAKAGRANIAHAGPQETYVDGLYLHLEHMPGSVSFQVLTGTSRIICQPLTTGTGFTVARAWILARIRGTPGDLTISIYDNNVNVPGTELSSVTVDYTRMDDILSEWLNETLAQVLAGTTDYWLVITGDASDDATNHWEIAVDQDNSGASTTSSDLGSIVAASFSLYYRLVPSLTYQSCVMFEYQEQMYFVLSGESGAPSLYMAGDRGAADSNAGALDTLVDATKSWTTDEHIGKVVMVIDGPGKTEKTNWRTVTANTATALTVDTDWLITHTTDTVYVLLGSELTEITGHGLTAPVTDVLVTTENMVLFAQGDSVNIRRMREYNNAGTWTIGWADDGTNKATLLDYEEKARKIIKTNNSDGSGNVSIATADAVAWATASHTFASAVNIGSRFRRITGTISYQDADGNEALWVMKEDIPWIVPTNTDPPYPVYLYEMRTVRATDNGKALCTNGVYLYFNLQQGLERYYSGQFDDIGPNLGEGLPENRRGPIVSMVSLPGKFYIAVDAGTAGYSSVMDSDGWHERYRAPLGQRIGTLGFQPIPGPTQRRMWVYQGGDLLYLPFPNETANELEDTTYPYTHEFSITSARLHAGIFDVQKMIKMIKLQSENLEVDTNGKRVCWFELDYRMDDETDWTTFGDAFTVSPTQTIDLSQHFGLAGKRIQFRIRGYTTDNNKTPVLLALIVNTVLRTDVKYSYPLNFRLMDHEPLLSLREEDPMTAMEKLQLIEELADASSSSMLRMTSVSPLYHDKLIFLNPPNTWQILHRGQDGNDFKRDVFICSATAQEA